MIATVALPDLHPAQREVMLSSARFKVLACGRRWGKTRLGAVACVAEALQGRRAWWVAPTYPMASIGWRLLKSLAQQIPGVQVREADRHIMLPTGGEIVAKSADRPDALRGEGLDFVVLDECAFIREEAWIAALRPALTDRQGRAMFISTPKGRNWFWRLWQQAHGKNGWAAWNYPTSANPHIRHEEIESARATLPDRVFRQEFLAEFVDDAGEVFRRVMEAATAQEQKQAVAGHEYVFGVDWGKHDDFTVIAVLDVTEKALVALDRFNQVDYALQTRRLRALYERFGPRIIVAERNAMGEPLVEQLQREGLPVQPFLTTAASKASAIEALALALERGELRILPDPTLVGELQAFEAQRLPSGLTRYGAPHGLHDDCVMALALAWSAVADSGPLLLWE